MHHDTTTGAATTADILALLRAPMTLAQRAHLLSALTGYDHRVTLRFLRDGASSIARAQIRERLELVDRALAAVRG